VTNKELVIETVQNLPETSSLEEIAEEVA